MLSLTDMWDINNGILCEILSTALLQLWVGPRLL